MEKMFRACLNLKVIGALALVGVGVWAVAPNLLVGALPILLIAACPLSMMFMMRGMKDDHHGTSPEPGLGSSPKATHEEQLADLKRQLEDTRGRQETIAREIAKVEVSAESERFPAS